MNRKKRERHARRERRKNAGLCMRCENPRTKGKVSCAKCRAYSTENQAQLRERNGIGRTPTQKKRRVALEEEYQAAGLCRCRRVARPGKRECVKCANISRDTKQALARKAESQSDTGGLMKIECRRCKKEKEERARGLCGACYVRTGSLGTRDRYALPRYQRKSRRRRRCMMAGCEAIVRSKGHVPDSLPARLARVEERRWIH